MAIEMPFTKDSSKLWWSTQSSPQGNSAMALFGCGDTESARATSGIKMSLKWVKIT